MTSGSTTELIKQKLDIVEFLRGYLEVLPAGKNFKARCPFHNEKTPSFMISPDRQSWHCFGCGLGGDIFGFLMRYENLEFGEALRVLAEKAGVELRRLNPAEYKLTGLLYELNEKAKEFFKAELRRFAGAKKYLVGRGLKQETIEEFELGWAPNEPESLSVHLLNSGYSPDDLLRAGLAVKTDRGLLLDRFRGRIMFPIHNHFGRVVGFTGRVLPAPSGADRSQFEAAKYVNSPETTIFNKSRLLYGFWKAKNFIREAGFVFLVEGQMDALMSFQAGIKNVAATSGTALTRDHLFALRRLCETIVLSFDSDDAGSSAAERAIDLAEENDFAVKVAAAGEFKDPAEAAQSNPQILIEAVKDAEPAPRFYFKKYLTLVSVDWSRRENLKNLRVVLAKLKPIASAIEREFWLKELCKITGIAEATLIDELNRIESAKMADIKSEVTDGGNERVLRHATRRELIGERLLRVAVAKSDFKFMEDSSFGLAAFQKKALELLKVGKKRSDDPSVDEFLGFTMLGAEDLPMEEINHLKIELAKEYWKDRRHELTQEIKNAEEIGDAVRLRKALAELQNIPSTTLES